jgi:hypothetical protein
MKIVYGRSMLEGAPFGNKNAAGSHKQHRRTFAGLVVGKSPVVLFQHKSSGGKITSRNYRATRSSKNRLERVLRAQPSVHIEPRTISVGRYFKNRGA